MNNQKNFTSLEQLNYEYYEHFLDFWLPIYRQQVFKGKFNNDIQLLLEIKDNIWKNWILDIESKKNIIKQLGLKYLDNRKGETK